MMYVCVLPLLVAVCSANQVRNQRPASMQRFIAKHHPSTIPAPEAEVVKQRMENEGDAQYTIRINVGGQEFRTIPDTGSFDLLLFSADCTTCGAGLYDHNQSTTYAVGTLKSDQYFGSGTTFAQEAFESVKVGRAQVDRQMFWEVYDADMPILESSTFQSILGVGPPTSVVEMALQEAAEVRSQIDDMKKNGAYITDDLASEVENYMQVAEHGKTQKTFIAGLKMRTFSVCLRPHAGAEGTWVWNDDSLENQPEMFSTVNVVGDMYWSTEMMNVGLGKSRTGDALPLGCDKSRCNAVLDTGTSFIVMPQEAYNKIEESVVRWRGSSGKCPDLTLLPNLEFTLGGESFSLPPESYVGEMSGEIPAHLEAMMPASLLRAHKGKSSETRCAPLLLTMDEASDYGPVWILGQPFFRKYYSSFTLSEGSEKASSMSFSLHDDCRPTRGEELLRKVKPRRESLQIDVSKVRVPRWVSNKYKHHVRA